MAVPGSPQHKLLTICEGGRQGEMDGEKEKGNDCLQINERSEIF